MTTMRRSTWQRERDPHAALLIVTVVTGLVSVSIAIFGLWVMATS